MDVNDALETFLGTDASYGGGLSNHGPMAVEALVHLDVPQWIGPFVEHYRPRLEMPRAAVVAAPNDWAEWVRPRLDALVTCVASQAGHGLLRVAHAIRGLERAEDHDAPTAVYRRELGAAVAYWEVGGPGIPGPESLIGPSTMTEWFDGLGRLGPAERSDGLLTATLANAARSPRFASTVAALAPSSDPTTTLDSLGALAADVFRRNVADSAFAILHGTTVSAMAPTLLPHLDDGGQQRLVAAVAGFVAAAVMGFDDQREVPALEATPASAELADLAGSSREDHTIKFVDACISISERSGNRQPLVAAFQQIERPYGVSIGRSLETTNGESRAHA